MMKRSSSSILRLKGHEDEVEKKASGQSVTVISKEQLPTYSTERFYMLSELQMQAHQPIFLCYHSPPVYHGDEGTVETTEESMDSIEGQEFMPFTILYLVWSPGMTNSTKTFVESVLLDTITRIQDLAHVTSSIRKKDESTNSDEIKPDSDAAEHHIAPITANDDESSRTTSLYVVIDRVSPVSEQKAWWGLDQQSAEEARFRLHQVEEKLGEELARSVATHLQLCSICEGITVGVANHERAAPGLKACMNAVNVGAKDRRRLDSSAECKSLIGLVTPRPDEFLGSQSDQETDAAQGVLQSRICAEWNGQGDLQSFARRAHSLWRKHQGLPMEAEPFSRRKISRIRKSSIRSIDERALDRAVKAFLFDAIAITIIVSYILFHYRKEFDFFVENYRR